VEKENKIDSEIKQEIKTMFGTGLSMTYTKEKNQQLYYQNLSVDLFT